MTSWEEVLHKVEIREADSMSAVSDKRHLQNIFSKAEFWGVSPENPAKAGLSNLRAIVPSALRAVKERNKGRLEELLLWAATMTHTQLRIKLQANGRDQVEVEVGSDHFFDAEEPYFLLKLDNEQLLKIARSCQRQFVFTINGVDVLEK